MGDSTKVKGVVRNKRTWTKEEDEKLIDVLTELHATGRYRADNGFRPGHFQAIETLLDKSLPDSGLKAEPHIKSRWKTLRTNFNIMNDMVLGSSTSGFGWNPDKCLLTAPKEVWAEYLKSHKNASVFRDKPFPYYHQLATVFGQDRATGCQAVDLGEEEVVLETQEHISVNLEEGEAKKKDMGVNLSRGGTDGTSKKRKRSTPDDFIRIYADSSKTLNNTLTAIGNEMNSNLSKMVADGAPDVDLMMRVQNEIDSLPGITFEEGFEAIDVIGSCSLKSGRFLGYDQEKKVLMVQMIARKSTR